MPMPRPRTKMRSSSHQLGGSIDTAALIGLLPLPRVYSLDGTQPHSCCIRKMHDTNGVVHRSVIYRGKAGLITHLERVHVHLQEKKRKSINVTLLSPDISCGDPLVSRHIPFLIIQFWSRPPFMVVDQDVDERKAVWAARAVAARCDGRKNGLKSGHVVEDSC